MRMAREEEAITQTFTNYIQTFQTLAPHRRSPTSTSRVFLSPRRECVSWQPLPMLKHCSPKSWRASRPAAMRGAS
jgi:hypothetical protein